MKCIPAAASSVVNGLVLIAFSLPLLVMARMGRRDRFEIASTGFLRDLRCLRNR